MAECADPYMNRYLRFARTGTETQARPTRIMASQSDGSDSSPVFGMTFFGAGVGVGAGVNVGAGIGAGVGAAVEAGAGTGVGVGVGLLFSSSDSL